MVMYLWVHYRWVYNNDIVEPYKVQEIDAADIYTDYALTQLDNAVQIPQDVLTNGVNGDIIMKKGEGLELSRYVNSNDRLYEYARNITPLDGYEDQVIHGDKYGFEIRDLDGKTASVYTPREFAEILRQDPNYHGGNIRLISCYAGAEDGIAAQALANQLGVDVLAPSDVLIVYPDGSMKIGYDGKGKWILYRKR